MPDDEADRPQLVPRVIGLADATDRRKRAHVTALSYALLTALGADEVRQVDCPECQTVIYWNTEFSQVVCGYCGIAFDTHTGQMRLDEDTGYSAN